MLVKDAQSMDPGVVVVLKLEDDEGLRGAVRLARLECVELHHRVPSHERERVAGGPGTLSR